MAGAVCAWGVIAPSLIATGKAVGIAASEEFPLVSYQGLNFDDVEDYTANPSPRYWLLWPGVLMMMVYSFVDLGMSMIPMFKGTCVVAYWIYSILILLQTSARRAKA